MRTLSLQNLNHKRYFIRLNSAADIDSVVRIALDAAVAQIEAEVAVIYLLNHETDEFNAIARRSTFAPHIPDVASTLKDATGRWLESLRGPAQGKPSHDPFFGKLPETIQHRLERVLVAPLRDDEELLGILTIGRSEDREFDESEVAIARRSAQILEAVIERDRLRQKLAERKVERAKGILQRRRRVSEEQAYHILRNAGRRRRQPMAELAREIIETQLLSPLVRDSEAALSGH
jgi:GAF domain-containing protein